MPHHTHRLFPIPAFLFAVFGVTGYAATNDVAGSYSAAQGTLPTAQGWSVGPLSSPTPAPTVTGGILRLGPTDHGGYQYWNRHDIISDFNTPSGLQLELHLRVISSTSGPGGFANSWRTGFVYQLRDQLGRVAALGISDAGVRLSTDQNLFESASSPLIPLNTTSQFNVYLVTANSSGVSLLVNGAFVTSLPLGTQNGPPNEHWFGDGTTAGSCEVQILQVSWGSSLDPGSRYCGPAVPNSTGLPATLVAEGSVSLIANNLELVTTCMPLNASGYFLTSRNQGFLQNVVGSQGHLCLGAAIGRYVGPGQVLNSGAAGEMRLMLDLDAMPTPTGLVAAQVGEVWNFTSWYRDSNPASTSNFSDALAITFTF